MATIQVVGGEKVGDIYGSGVPGPVAIANLGGVGEEVLLFVSAVRGFLKTPAFLSVWTFLYVLHWAWAVSLKFIPALLEKVLGRKKCLSDSLPIWAQVVVPDTFCKPVGNVRFEWLGSRFVTVLLVFVLAAHVWAIGYGKRMPTVHVRALAYLAAGTGLVGYFIKFLTVVTFPLEVALFSIYCQTVRFDLAVASLAALSVVGGLFLRLPVVIVYMSLLVVFFVLKNSPEGKVEVPKEVVYDLSDFFGDVRLDSGDIQSVNQILRSCPTDSFWKHVERFALKGDRMLSYFVAELAEAHSLSKEQAATLDKLFSDDRLALSLRTHLVQWIESKGIAFAGKPAATCLEALCGVVFNWEKYGAVECRKRFNLFVVRVCAVNGLRVNNGLLTLATVEKGLSVQTTEAGSEADE
jgi:hypothetical protein